MTNPSPDTSMEQQGKEAAMKHRDTLPIERQRHLEWRFVRRVLSDSERQYQTWLQAAITKGAA